MSAGQLDWVSGGAGVLDWMMARMPSRTVADTREANLIKKKHIQNQRKRERTTRSLVGCPLSVEATVGLVRVVDPHGVEGAAVVGAHKGAGPAGQALVGGVGLGKEAVLSLVRSWHWHWKCTTFVTLKLLLTCAVQKL